MNRLRLITIIFTTITLILLPVALNGCGTGTSNDDTYVRDRNRHIYILGVGYTEKMPASMTISANTGN